MAAPGPLPRSPCAGACSPRGSVGSPPRGWAALSSTLNLLCRGSLCAGWGLSRVTLGTSGCQVVGRWRGKMTWPSDGTGGKSGRWMLALLADNDSYRGGTLGPLPLILQGWVQTRCVVTRCVVVRWGRFVFTFASLLYGWLASRGLGAQVLPSAGQSPQKPCKGFKLLCSLPFHRKL